MSSFRVEVNNYLQTIERNGTKIGKARITALAKLPETIRECRPKPVVRPTVIKPKPVMRTAEIPLVSMKTRQNKLLSFRARLMKN